MRIQADKSISEFLNSLISISESAPKIQHSHSLLLQKIRTATINRWIDKVSATTLITNYLGDWSRLWFLLVVNTFWILSSSLTANWMFYGCGQNKTFENVILGPPQGHGEMFISEVLFALPPNSSELRFFMDQTHRPLRPLPSVFCCSCQGRSFYGAPLRSAGLVYLRFSR